MEQGKVHGALWERSLTRRQLLRGTGAAAVALGLPTLLSACGSEAESGGMDLVTIAPTGPITTLDPVGRSPDISVASANSLVVESLVTVDERGVIGPALAQSIDTPDDVTYVFKLRKGAEFSDGSPLTPEDVVASIERAIDPELSLVAEFLLATDRVEATGPDEVTITLKAPAAPYLATLSSYAGHIYKRSELERLGSKLGTPDGLFVGTGPYVFEQFRPGEFVTFRRNDGYWGKAPVAERIELRDVAEDGARLLAIRQGDLDGSFDVPPNLASQWESAAKLTLVPSLAIVQMTFNLGKQPFDEFAVRKAFAHAINRQAVLDTVYSGNGRVARCIVPEGQWGSLLDAEGVRELYQSFPQYEFDLDLARKALSESSVAEGFATSIEVPDTDPPLQQTAEIWADGLRNIGVDLEVRSVTVDAWIQGLAGWPKKAISLWAPAPDYPDAANNVYNTHLSEFAREGGFNVGNYRNREVDRLLEAQRGEQAPARRVQLLAEAIRMTQEQLTAAVVVDPDYPIALNHELAFSGLSAYFHHTAWATALERA